MADSDRLPPLDPDPHGMGSRLAAYGLSPASAFPHSVVVPPGRKLTLSGQGLASPPPGYARLRPRTMDDVKRWIGIPDAVSKLKTNPARPIPSAPIVTSPEEFARLRQPDIQALRDVAQRYVYEDSTIVANYLPTLDYLLADAQFTGVFLLQDIDVLSGGSLEISADLRVLVANQIRLWKGGSIKLRGPVKIDCYSIEGEYQAEISPEPTASSALLGTITTLEVTTHEH